MKQFILLVTVLYCTLPCLAQRYTSASIFAHNDYAQPIPFNNAYDHAVGFIEADIFLEEGELLVAHTRKELVKTKTLQRLYLELLKEKVALHQGSVFADPSRELRLMIDLKTDGEATLQSLVDVLGQYPSLTACSTLRIVISGNVPTPERWHRYPSFIHFDGRPGTDYTKEQLARIDLISDDFKRYSLWDGKAIPSKKDRIKIIGVLNAVHRDGKKLRFWGVPDDENAWKFLMDCRIDILGTDHVDDLFKMISRK